MYLDDDDFSFSVFQFSAPATTFHYFIYISICATSVLASTVQYQKFLQNAQKSITDRALYYVPYLNLMSIFRVKSASKGASGVLRCLVPRPRGVAKPGQRHQSTVISPEDMELRLEGASLILTQITLATCCAIGYFATKERVQKIEGDVERPWQAMSAQIKGLHPYIGQKWLKEAEHKQKTENN